MSDKAYRLIDLAQRRSIEAEIAEQKYLRDRWVEARAAYGVVGLNEPGLTQQLAATIRRYNAQTGKWECVQVDTVESLAHAYEMFVFLMQHLPIGQDSRLTRKLRRRYSYSRFAALWHAWKEYEPEPERLYSALELDTGIRGMMATITDAEHPLTQNQRRRILVSSQIRKLYEDDEDSEIRAWARAGVELFERKQLAQL